MTDESARSYAPDVVTTYVWDAIKEIPGIADLHHGPFHALSGKVHLELQRPVHLHECEGRNVLEVHLVVYPDAVIPALADRVRQAATTYLKTTTGIELDEVSVFVDDLAPRQASGA